LAQAQRNTQQYLNFINE